MENRKHIGHVFNKLIFTKCLPVFVTIVMLLSGLLVLATSTSASSGVIRVDDMGTGLREAIVAPADELRNTPREFYRHGRSQFGIEVSEFTMRYNLQNRDGREAGFENITAGNTVVYDQRPYLVLNTHHGHRWTNTWQHEIFEGGVWSSGYYRDFKLRPFSFADYSNAIGSFQYHVFADRILEETRVAHDSGSIGNVTQVYIEYPIAFSSYQVYEGAALTPVQKTEINSGALIVRRPNGSLFGFTFPQSPANGNVEIFEHNGQLIVRHFASLNHIESIRENTRIFRWGRRIFAAANHNASRDRILSEMSEELNPLPSNAFNLSILSHNHNYHTQAHEILEHVNYDPIAGYYRYRIEGISWGGSIKDVPFRYPGLRVTVNSNRHRSIFLMQETTSPDNAAVLQDDFGYVLPVSIGIARSLGGEGNPDWTGDWTSRDHFMGQFERFGWGRSIFPVRMQPNQTLNFRVLHMVHRWGPNQFVGTGSVISHVPLFTSTAGVWCVLDLNPWYGSVGDFRGFSSSPTGYAWGEVIPGNEEQFAQALEFTLSSIGDRNRDYQGARNITHNLSNFKIPLHYDIDNGKADLNIVVSALPDTNESRILVDVEFAINQDIHISQGERIRFIRVMNPFHVLFYNAFWRSTSGGGLQPSHVTLDPGLHVPGNHVQTAILEGNRPAFSLADKRWLGDPHNPNPHNPDHYNFRGVEGNIHVQVFDKEFIINGQPANEQLALRISKAQPNTNHWHNKNHFHGNEHYISYDLVLERDNFTLRAGDRISLSYMVQPYGGKAINNEINSAQRTHDHYNLPSVSVISGSNASDPDYPWVPVVRSANGSTAEFTLQGGLDKLTFSVEGLHSWRPVRLFRVNNGHREEIHYRVNGHDGYRSYVDSEGLVGISIPVSMNNGAPVRLVVEQDNHGINPPHGGGPTISSISSQTIAVNTNTGPLSFSVGHTQIDPGQLQLSRSSSNTALVPNANIVFGGSGANRTVTVTPAAGQLGSSTITVTVSDGERTSNTSFVVNVVSGEPPIAFNFDNGTMQGWQVTSTDGQARQYFAVVPPTVNSPNEAPQSGSHFIGMHVPALSFDEPVYTQDNAHGTLVMRSPEFTLNGSGDLSVWLSGGGGGFPSLAGTNVSALPSTSSDGGFMGIALRNVNTGNYVLSGTKTSPGNEWEQVRFTTSELAALPQDHVYTIDLIDARHGSWGWINMDSVTIPGALTGEISDPVITPYVQINGGDWLQQTTATLCAGGTVSFGPHPVDDGWQWTGPNGFTANVRNVTISDITTAQAGNYVATHIGSGSNITYTVNVHSLPEATVSVVHETCEGENGRIVLTFPDHPTRNNISFSIDGGETYPVSVNDNTGSYEFTGLAPGIYDVWARWGNRDCPVDLGLHVIHPDPYPRANVAITHASGGQNNGAITLTFPDVERRANISFSINGGANYTTVPDNSGSYTFSNLAAGNYDVWSRWGNQQCPMKLGDYTIILQSGEGSLVYSDQNSFDGWTDVSTDPQGRQFFAIVPPIVNSPNIDPHTGSHFIGLHVPALTFDEPVYTQDNPHGTHVLRSPEFTLNGSGDLVAWLSGGGAGSPSLAGTSVGALPSTSSDGGFMGIALRNVNTGNYVLSANKNSEGNEWQQVTFTAAQLAALPQDHVYTLDLIDARHGGWGWVNMDSVTIPGALLGEEPAARPSISSISSQTILVNTNTGPLSFTVGSNEVDPGALTLSRSSSNTTLVPNANVVFGGSGANRTVTVTPAAGQIGSASITITVSDGERTAGTSFALNVVSDALPVSFDFAGGMMQGWSVTSTDGEARQYFAVVPPILNSPNEAPHSGSHFIGLHVPAFSLDAPVYTQDQPHGTLIFRSPEFALNGAGDLTAWLAGGGADSPSLAGTSVSALPASSSDGGFLGIALRNVNTGNYVLSGSKTSSGNEWEQVTFTAAQLAALSQNHVYTLDLIDARHGGWGWVNMDSVTIPGTFVDESLDPVTPWLVIERSGESQVRLSWRADATSWTLQRSERADGEYVDAGLPVSVEGDENVAYDTILPGSRFYRLSQ